MRHDMLGIYLNDHLAGATTGQLLSRHLARRHRSAPYGGELGRVADEIAADRRVLLGLMERLSVPARRHKIVAGRLAEKARLLKLNGRVARRSGLSTFVELETLRLGIEGKALLWQTLRELGPTGGALDEPQLEALVARAQDQINTVESIRRNTATDTFGDSRVTRTVGA
ncbi:hypothetical protein AB0F77_03840 [Streptomyces sp. NPDC026672]|uniref:hypothetical protein n=1 Tax=unclassified Streptomyces TaxID=2593676 RepID=UPI0034087A44